MHLFSIGRAFLIGGCASKRTPDTHSPNVSPEIRFLILLRNKIYIVHFPKCPHSRIRQ